MPKRYHDWYKMQQDTQGWDAIPADKMVAKKLEPLHLSIDFTHCHYGLKKLLSKYECDDDCIPDFYLVTELELGKLPLGDLFALYKKLYDRSKVGIYLAVLSYYLQPDKTYPHLTGSYSENIDRVFRENLSFADRIENCSTVIDYPLVQAQVKGFMEEGANYIFVHPNIKFWLWKKT